MRFLEPIIAAAFVLAAPAGDAPVTVAVQVRGDRPLVEVTLDGRVAHMVLDTGASETTLMRDAPARLGLDLDDARPAEQSLSYGQPFTLRFARVHQVAFAGRTVTVDDVAVDADGGAEPGVDGFFTDDRLAQADIDLAHGRLFLDVQDAPAWTHQPGVATVALEDRRRLFGQAMVNGQVVRVLFDTGSPGSSMTLAAAKRAGVAVAGPPDDGVYGLGATRLRAWNARVADIRLGAARGRDVPMLVVDKPNASADMIAGFDFFRRHRVWIDRRHNRLVFTPIDDSHAF